VALASRAKPGDTVLDLCAGNGGKSLGACIYMCVFIYVIDMDVSIYVCVYLCMHVPLVLGWLLCPLRCGVVALLVLE
jgi:predicted RNA methylase